MFDYDKWQEIYLTIRKHKLRTALTAFGVFWGIFMLVVLLGAGNGLENGVMRDFDIAKNSVFVWTQRTSIPYKGFKSGRFINLNNDDIIAIRSNINEVDVIAPRNIMSGSSINRKDKSASFTVFGDYPEYLEVKSMLISRGRFINDLDIREKRKIAVIGRRVVEVLFDPEEDPIGEYIRVNGVHFKVAGIFDTRQKGEGAIYDVQTIYIPNTAMQHVFNQGNKIGWFAFLPKERIRAAVVEEKAKLLLAKRHKVHPDDRQAFASQNMEEVYQKMQTLFAGIRGFSWIVAIGTIIAGMVGVGNIMMIIVKDRTKEIGIRKSVGARPWSLISMIIQESLVITGLSGYLGFVLGVVLVEAINYIMVRFNLESGSFANPEIDFQVAVSAIIVLAVAGTLAGLIPGTKAAKVDPVIALRDEQ
jgi:putative ABC transport system permease protein